MVLALARDAWIVPAVSALALPPPFILSTRLHSNIDLNFLATKGTSRYGMLNDEMRMTEPSEEMEDFMKSLRKDRLLDIYIGQATNPCKISQSTLASISDFFANAIKYNHLGGGPPGNLSFSDDDETAWQLLLWWKMKGSVPSAGRPLHPSEVLSYVQAWIMGDQYDVKEFQDDLMLELILWLERNVLDLSIAKVAFESTMPGSALRVLMAEEIAHQIRQAHAPGAFYKLLSPVECIVGFTAELVDALDMYELFGKDDLKRHRSTFHQKRFMIGNGPRRGRSLRDQGASESSTNSAPC